MKEECKNMAVIKRYWPGNEPDLVCIEHAQDSKRIADAMGFHITLEPNTSFEVVDGEFPTCCCTAEFSQEVTTG